MHTLKNAAVLCTFVDTRHAIEDFTYAEDYLDKWVKGQVKIIQQFPKVVGVSLVSLMKRYSKEVMDKPTKAESPVHLSFTAKFIFYFKINFADTFTFNIIIYQ